MSYTEEVELLTKKYGLKIINRWNGFYTFCFLTFRPLWATINYTISMFTISVKIKPKHHFKQSVLKTFNSKSRWRYIKKNAEEPRRRWANYKRAGGKIRSKDTIAPGNDPNPPKGKENYNIRLNGGIKYFNGVQDNPQ